MSVSFKPLRAIRSFVRRDGRITPAQRRALVEYWPRYGVSEDANLSEWPAIFGRSAPVILEIGFGNGEALAAAALLHPENNYLGVEVHRPGVGSLLRRLNDQMIPNVRVLMDDATEVLANRIPDASLTGVHIFFPDPWPKKRHHKRRLIQPDFSARLARKLLSGGYCHVATDWMDYADQMRTVLSGTPGLVEDNGSPKSEQHIVERLSTRFEQRGRRLGHAVYDMVYRRAG